MINEKMRNNIIEWYLQGESLETVRAKTNYKSVNSIKRILLDNGVNMRSRAGFKKPFNERFFEVIDREEKAYFLGLMISDGNVHNRNKEKSQKCISIELIKSDELILHKFKELLETENQICYERSCARIRVHSDLMAMDLAKYGVVERKSTKEVLPDIDKRLMKHLIRGVIDGDGWYQHKGITKGSKVRVGVCGSFELLDAIHKHFMSELDVSSTINVHKCSSKNYKLDFYQIQFCGKKDVGSIVNYLYDDATFFLQRKYDIIQHMLTPR